MPWLDYCKIKKMFSIYDLFTSQQYGKIYDN
jgi:hypothetical protein